MEGPDYIIFRRKAYRGRAGGGTNIKRKEEKKRDEMDRIEDCCLHTGFVKTKSTEREALNRRKGKEGKHKSLKKKKKKNN